MARVKPFDVVNPATGKTWRLKELYQEKLDLEAEVNRLDSDLDALRKEAYDLTFADYKRDLSSKVQTIIHEVKELWKDFRWLSNRIYKTFVELN